MLKIKKHTSLLLLVACISNIALQAQTMQDYANKLITNELSFETKADIQNWHTKNSKLSLSDAHFKSGEKSLEWNWQKGASISINNLKGLKEAGDLYPGGQPEFYEPSYYPKQRFGGIKMWLYQEKPSTEKMIFQVGSNAETAQKSPKYRFNINLNFTGWRAVWVAFEEDAKVENYKGSDEMNNIYIYPDKKIKTEGKLFIDHFLLLNFVSNKRHSDMVFTNHKLTHFRDDDGYEILPPYQQYLDYKFPQQIDANQLAKESKHIADKLEFLILGDQTTDYKERKTGIENVVAKKIEDAEANYQKLQLTKKNGFVNGIPLFSIRDEHIPKNGQIYDVVFLNSIFQQAMDYRLNNNTSAKEKSLLTLDYLLDQGWAAGTSSGTVDHVIKVSPIASTVFLLREELKAQNKLQQQTEMLIWHTQLGKLLNIDYTKGENSDRIRGGALAKLMTILLMENDGRKQKMMDEFKNYMDHAIAISPGYSDTFKPDFSIYHHAGTYLNTYGTNALNTMALIHWLLTDTPYALSANSTEVLKKALCRQAEIAFGVNIHPGVGGRFPDMTSSIDRFTLPAFAFMSMKDNDVADPEMANLFNYLYTICEPKNINTMLMPNITYSGTFGTLNLMVRLHRLAGKNFSRPADGVTVMPYSGLLTFRKDKAFATVKGYNKYVWDFEGGKGENMLGRYISFGTLLLAQGDDKNGFNTTGLEMNNGFDWAFLPGATTKALPVDKMTFIVQGDPKYIEGKHRNFSESVIASGLSQNGNGIFALDLRDDVFPDEEKTLFDSTFRAKKSYFFIGNEIICLGSNINNDDSRYSTVTTLFQYKFDANRTNFFNGKSIGNNVNLNQKANGGYFTDQNGLHYIVPDGQKIVFQQAPQASYKNEKAKFEKSNETYLKSWIDHGSSPKDEGYEYEILVNTPTDKVLDYLKPRYEILQKDASAHIIEHKNTGITAYAVFDAKKSLKGPLSSTDTPIMAMFKVKEVASILTIADPDFHQEKWNHNMSLMPEAIKNAPNKASIVTLTLKGEWFLAAKTDELLELFHQNGNTTLKIFCKDGKSIDIPLQQDDHKK